MKRLDSSVNELNRVELEEGLFQGTWQPIDFDNVVNDKRVYYK